MEEINDLISLHGGRNIQEDTQWAKQETHGKIRRKSLPNQLKKRGKKSNKRRRNNKTAHNLSPQG
jgi:hypothetical protein